MINELSIIIPTLNEESYISKLLSCLLNQSYQGKLEVIIVDGNSTDKTIASVEEFKKKLNLRILKTERGIAYQRNKGAKEAKYKHLLFLDADMKIPKFFVQKLLQKFNNSENFIATTFCFVSEFDLLSYLTAIVMLVPVMLIFISEHFVPGFLIFTTKENHKKLNGFNEKLELGEDLDYGKRSYLNGTPYHLFLYPYAFHSARRMKKMGRFNFFLTYLIGFYYMKRYGIPTLKDKINYPFGNYR